MAAPTGAVPKLLPTPNNCGKETKVFPFMFPFYLFLSEFEPIPHSIYEAN